VAQEPSEEVHEDCGVFAATSRSRKQIFESLYWGLLSLNHRGQQSFGFLTYEGTKDKSNSSSSLCFHSYEELGLVPTERSKVESLARELKGFTGLGNARYATSGGLAEQDLKWGVQPFTVSKEGNQVSISYNGNIVNAKELKRELREQEFPYDFKTDCDTEVLCAKMLFELSSGATMEEAVLTVLERVEGAYSVAMMSGDGELYAFRDPFGIRPFCLGQSEEGDIVAFSSETVGLNINGFQHLGEVKPGELIHVTKDSIERKQLVVKPRKSLCAFEFAYFSRPDSILNGTERPVYRIREEFARNLAKENPDINQKADLIISIPETSDDAAYGLHEATGIRWERAVRKNRYMTKRAFIEVRNERDSVIDKKMNINPREFQGKRVAIVEDSIVRGDTSRINVAKIRKLGASEVHLYVTFPKIVSPCPYGVDMATFGELIGSTRSDGEIAKAIGADSVNYQSVEGLSEAIGIKKEELCLGCVTGRYPTKIAQEMLDKSKESFMKGNSERGRVYEATVAE
jgi:amidophosphoribosyltransferase